MIRKYDEEYSDLMIPDDGSERRVLKSLEPEYVPFPEQRVSNILLFLYTQKPGGFEEHFCLNQEHKDRLASIRKNIEKNPDLLMNVVLVLEKYLSISYEEFCKLSIFEQSQLLEKTRACLKDEDRELFMQVFKDLSTKYKTKELKLNETESK